MRDADDLYADIPVGAAKFEAMLQKFGEGSGGTVTPNDGFERGGGGGPRTMAGDGEKGDSATSGTMLTRRGVEVIASLVHETVVALYRDDASKQCPVYARLTHFALSYVDSDWHYQAGSALAWTGVEGVAVGYDVRASKLDGKYEREFHAWVARPAPDGSIVVDTASRHFAGLASKHGLEWKRSTPMFIFGHVQDVAAQERFLYEADDATTTRTRDRADAGPLTDEVVFPFLRKVIQQFEAERLPWRKE